MNRPRPTFDTLLEALKRGVEDDEFTREIHFLSDYQIGKWELFDLVTEEIEHRKHGL